MHAESGAGFTLIEVLVAMVIVSTALVAMVGRLGASSDVQHTLVSQTFMLDTALDMIERQRLVQKVNSDEEEGDITSHGANLHWKLWSEATDMEGFLRQNLTVSMDHEPDLSLFLYRRVTN